MSDIVERLREAGAQGADLSPGDPLCAEAADEIKSLREALEEIAVTTKGYPNATREGDIARAALPAAT